MEEESINYDLFSPVGKCEIYDISKKNFQQKNNWVGTPAFFLRDFPIELTEVSLSVVLRQKIHSDPHVLQYKTFCQYSITQMIQPLEAKQSINKN